MHRPTLGAVSLLLLLFGSVLYFGFPGSSTSIDWVLMRAGALCGVLWLAHPQLQRVPKSAWIGILLLVVVLARLPRLFPFALVILLILAVLSAFGRRR